MIALGVWNKYFRWRIREIFLFEELYNQSNLENERKTPIRWIKEMFHFEELKIWSCLWSGRTNDMSRRNEVAKYGE